MKQTWSRSWNASKQPRKQRKFRAQAPLHVKHKFLSAHLSETLRTSTKRRSLPIRKGDEVLVMRGASKGVRANVEKVSLTKGKIYLSGVNVKKVDGSEVLRPFQPSNLLITKLNTDDKARKTILDRTAPKEMKK